MVMSGVNEMGAAHRELSMKRRQLIKPSLSAESSGLCGSQVPVTDLLFGNNLEKDLSASKATSKIMKNMQSSSSQHYQPFHQRNKMRGFPHNRALNWKRPLQPTGRGGRRQFRGRP